MTRKLKYEDAFWGTDYCSTSGFDVLQRRMKDGRQMCKDMEQFFKQRAKIEEEYAKNLQKCARQAGGNTEIGTLKDAWECLRLETDKIAQEHLELSNAINEAVIRVNNFSESQKTKRRPDEEAVGESYRKKKKNFDKAAEAKKFYDKQCHDLEMLEYQVYQAKQSGTQSLLPKEWDKLYTRHNKSQQDAKKSEQSYRQSIELLEQTRQQWEHEMKHACQVFEKLDEDRICFIRNELWVHCNTLSKTWVDDDDHSEQIRKTLGICQIDNDIEIFIRNKSTGFDKPAKIEYEPYQNGGSSSTGTISSRPAAPIPN